MRAPCAEKLAELRAACDRIIQAPEKRKAMTPARKRRMDGSVVRRTKTEQPSHNTGD